MKKLLVLGLMSLTLAQAKIFVGVDGGYVMRSHAPSGVLDSGVWHGYYGHTWNIGANFGVEHFFNDRIGVRALMDIIYSRPFDLQFNTLNFGLGSDLLFNIITGGFSMGIFAGAEVGYKLGIGNGASNSIEMQGDIPIFGRTGLSFGMGEHVRLDLTVKLPIISWNIHTKAGGTPVVDMPIIYQAGFKFLF